MEVVWCGAPAPAVENARHRAETAVKVVLQWQERRQLSVPEEHAWAGEIPVRSENSWCGMVSACLLT